MAQRKLLNKLLLGNSQYKKGELRYNHEAIALLLQHRNATEWQRKQLFLAAGSEDIRALLPKLLVDNHGDEAFVVVRPYVHTMLLYFRREKDGLKIYFFESQGWGLRYYPTRLILQAITAQFPEANIYLTMHESQPRHIQRGCVEYTFACIEYLVAHGSKFFQEFDNRMLECIEASPSTVIVDMDACINQVRKIDCEASWQRHLKMLGEIVSRLRKNENLMLKVMKSAKKILKLDQAVKQESMAEIITALSGMSLPDLRTRAPLAAEISVDAKSSTVTITFPDDDYIYANCLIYSAALIPGEVKRKSKNLQLVLQDHPDVKAVYDPRGDRLCYSATSLLHLQTAFESLLKDSHIIFDAHMRQQLGLAVIVNEITQAIKLERELALAMRNGHGGLDIWQTQAVLHHLLQPIKSVVYVPSWDEISNADAVLDLKKLRASGYACVVYAYPLVDVQHQVGVRIDLTKETLIAEVYDSQPFSNTLDKEFCERQTRLLGNDVVLQIAPSFFARQVDDWSCAIHVIANLLTVCGLRDASMPDNLPVTKLARHYISMWLAHQNILDHKEEDAATLYAEKLLEELQKAEGREPLASDKNNDMYVDLFATEFQLVLNKYNVKRNESLRLLRILADADNDKDAIAKFLVEIDCVDYGVALANLSVHLLRHHMLKRICAETISIAAAENSVEHRSAVEGRERQVVAAEAVRKLGFVGEEADELVALCQKSPSFIMILRMPITSEILRRLESGSDRFETLRKMSTSAPDASSLINCCPYTYQMKLYKELLLIESKEGLNNAVAAMSDEHALLFASDYPSLFPKNNKHVHYPFDSYRIRRLRDVLKRYHPKLTKLVLKAISKHNNDFFGFHQSHFMLLAENVPREYRYYLYTYFDLLADIHDVVPILMGIQKSDWSSFVEGHKVFFRTNEDNLAPIFEKLGSESKLEFAICLCRVLSVYRMYCFAKFLTHAQLYTFAGRVEVMLDDGVAVTELLGYLPPEFRLEFALKYLNKMNSPGHLIKVFSLLTNRPNTDPLIFLEAAHQQIAANWTSGLDNFINQVITTYPHLADTLNQFQKPTLQSGLFGVKCPVGSIDVQEISETPKLGQ